MSLLFIIFLGEHVQRMHTWSLFFFIFMLSRFLSLVRKFPTCIGDIYLVVSAMQ